MQHKHRKGRGCWEWNILVHWYWLFCPANEHSWYMNRDSALWLLLLECFRFVWLCFAYLSLVCDKLADSAFTSCVFVWLFRLWALATCFCYNGSPSGSFCLSTRSKRLFFGLGWACFRYYFQDNLSAFFVQMVFDFATKRLAVENGTHNVDFLCGFFCFENLLRPP